MTDDYRGPRIGGQAVVHSGLVTIVELAVRDRVPGVVVDDGAVRAWVPLAWISIIHDVPGGGR